MLPGWCQSKNHQLQRENIHVREKKLCKHHLQAMIKITSTVMDVRVGLWRKLSAEELMLLDCGVEDSWESLGLQEDPTSPSKRRSVLGVHWKDLCWSWNFNTLATWCEELTYWKRPWCWEILGTGRGGDDRGWDGWMASPTRWTWVWVNSGSWWWTGRPGVLRFTGSQRVRHDWATELNWTELEARWRYHSCTTVGLPPRSASVRSRNYHLWKKSKLFTSLHRWQSRE